MTHLYHTGIVISMNTAPDFTESTHSQTATNLKGQLANKVGRDAADAIVNHLVNVINNDPFVDDTEDGMYLEMSRRLSNINSQLR